ncbi:MAG: hypothetical protein IJ087_02290 [Eggerthellaceae bacterium]|nr:hypothetical protein [Eggerthellaceae bacterium]
MNERRTIDVEDLVVDEENPRFEAVSTEDDALYSILADQKLGNGNKILNLARDIAAHGLNASELLIVSPIEGTQTYLVREGNRRVTAIKLSLNSERIPEDFRRLAPQFAELAAAMQAHRLIECCVCDNEQEIRRLLLLRHGGENNGIGTVKWNSTQTTRFNEEGNPQTARALSFVGHLQEDYGQGDLWKAAAVIPPTNLGRLITTPEVRQMLNVDLVVNDAHYLGGHGELLLDVLLTLKDKGVGAIYDKGARVHLVEEAAERIEPDGPRQAHLPLDTPVADEEEGSSGGGDDNGATSEAEGARSDANVRDGSKSPDSQNMARAQAAETSDPQQAHDVSDEVTADQGQSDATDAGTAVRRKPVSHSDDKRMFGHALRPKGNGSNDIYRGIDWIDEQYLKHPDELAHLLPILGFSLRLLMETVAREYFASIGEDRGDKALANFLKDVAKPAISAKIDTVGHNNMALASEWIDGKYNFEAFFAKWAHGTLAVDRSALVRQSELVALIIDEVWT